MKKLIAALLLLAAPSFASQYQGKLELSWNDPEAIVQRELKDGMWLAGGQYPDWHLVNTSDGYEVCYAAFFVTTRLEGQDPMFGESLNAHIAQGVYGVVNGVLSLTNSLSLAVVPPWLAKFDQYESVGVYGGGRFTVSPDDHHYGYGWQFTVRVPISEVLSFAKGSPGIAAGQPGGPVQPVKGL